MTPTMAREQLATEARVGEGGTLDQLGSFVLVVSCFRRGDLIGSGGGLLIAPCVGIGGRRDEGEASKVRRLA